MLTSQSQTRRSVFRAAIGAWLATHISPDPPADVLYAAESVQGWDAISDACEWMGASRAIRFLPLWKQQAKRRESDSAPNLTVHGNDIVLGSMHLGSLRYLHRTITPQESQTRIAYETFIARFLRYLERTVKVWAFEPTEAGVTIFVPEGREAPDIPHMWEAFVQEAFSAEAMSETLVLLLDSVKLAERGFSVPEVPVVSMDEADALAAFVYATARDIKARLRRYERQIAAGAKNADQLRQKITTQRTNYGEALEALEALEQSEPERMRRIRELADAFTAEATSQLKSTRAIVAKFVPYIKALIAIPADQYLVIPPLLTADAALLDQRLPGDSAGQSCYACGRVLPKPRRGEKSPVYKANKFILQAPSQTLQGYFAQTEPVICAVCAALAVACPIKAADDALIVTLREGSALEDQAPDKDDDAGYLYDQQLRMLTMGELNVAAGRYLQIAAKEQGPSGKPLKQQMGGYEYALLKVASLLPSDVLERFVVQVFQGANPRKLPKRHLIILSYLIEVFEVMPWVLRESKATYGAVADAVRYVERDALNLAIYRLFEKSERKDHFSEVVLAKLEEGRAAFAKGLEMDQQTDTAQRYKDIAGLTGVLYALVNRCDYEMRQRSVRDEDRNRELRKLIEDVGNANHFTYGVAEHLSGQSAFLWRTSQTQFIYDEALRLLTTIGADAKQREATDANGRRQLLVCFDDVDAIYACLFAGPYKDLRAQRDFTYELKLSLYSRFPELLRSNERKGAATTTTSATA